MTTSNKSPERRFRARSKLRRRFAGLLALGVALVGAGALYAVFAPEPQTAQAQGDPALLRQGSRFTTTPASSATARTSRASRTAARA